MSVIIKGMKMPKSCEECALWDIDHAYCRVPGVPWTDYFYGEARLDDCPLVEVPPHGRLIDADELHKVMYHRAFETDGDTMWQSGCWGRYRAIEKVQDAMPTIIEAEEGEPDVNTD